jgi:hypothetical protein
MNTTDKNPNDEFEELEKEMRWRDIPLINYLSAGVFILFFIMTFIGISFMDFSTMKFKIFLVFYFITIAALIISIIVLWRHKESA